MSATLESHNQELDALETVKFVSSTLFDVSAEKIIRLRAAFEKNKEFFQDISELYDMIKYTAIQRGDLPAKSAAATRVLLVAFTSNVRFYGSSNTDVMRSFIEQFDKTIADGIVIGRTGKIFMENYPINPVRLTFRSFEGDEPTPQEVKEFLSEVEFYDEVHVFYPSFVTIFTQKVSSLDITHTAQEGLLVKRDTEIDYIFEPELPGILKFFETRVRHLLFERVVLESELARTAARLFAMNGAQDRVEDEIRQVRRAVQKAVANFNDVRLLESFSAISKWKN